MVTSDTFSFTSHLINFAIVLYFASFLFNKDLLKLSDLFISFFGLFVSLMANILSVLEGSK